MTIKNKTTALLVAAMLLAGISPSAADTALAAANEGGALTGIKADTGTGSAESKEVIQKELRLKTGSRSAVINGKAESILRSPFISGGTIMVPLGVFRTAFGAETRLEDGDVVKMALGNRAVTLTIGSPIIWTKTAKIKAAAPPVMVNGVLMVPLRPVAEGLGATLSAANGEIIVKLTVDKKNSGDDSEPGSEETDKARVGSSYYGWSINNPGEMLPDGGDDGSYVSFSDTEGNYYLEIHVQTGQPEQDAESLLDNLIEEAKANQETVLHEETAEAGKVPYGRVISSDEDGIMWETRAYYADHKIYFVYFSLVDAYTYQDFDAYAGLLNSFQPSFDKDDNTLEDLSFAPDGSQDAYSYDYGISLTIPAGWEEGANGTDFIGPDGSSVHFSISTNPSGVTLESWTAQLKAKWDKLYIASAHRLGAVSEVELSGEQASLLKSEINNGSGWRSVYQVLLLKDGYRYVMEYTSAPKVADPASGQDTESAEDPVLRMLLDSVEIPFDQVKESFGKLEDRTMETDLSKTVTKTSTTYGFTIQIPRYWTPELDQFEESSVQYNLPGGSFKLATVQSDEPELYIGQLRNAYTAAAAGSSDFTLKGVENAQFAGIPATIFSIGQKLDGVPLSKRVIAFSHKGIFYKLTFTLNDANATEEQKAAMSKVEKSFAFLKQD
ncbi:stalk domain-containing protein [Paenibacillus caui]|uniref:stalk domain-containing protein n=1 Tax=Paenibacillus caui TaxID=2873927 RepID=UPI001CA84FB4|nr:stalk domain-containing protein [Paenibacillus caui]